MAKKLLHACKGILAKLNERPILIGGAVPYFMRRGSLPTSMSQPCTAGMPYCPAICSSRVLCGL